MLDNSDKKDGAIAKGEIFCDATRQQRWIVGSFLGIGDVGEMYEAGLFNEASIVWNAVLQIEPNKDGVPSAQMQFYVDNASSTDISNWKKLMNIPHLGVPALLGSGSHQYNGQKYRFVVLQRYGTDLWRLFVKNGRKFPEHTVYRISSQILSVLEYIQTRSDLRADIKSTNLHLDPNNENQVYLVNFGLASQTRNPSNYNGTIEYMSRDSHAEVQTARGVLESLLYNMIMWLCDALPWEKNLNDLSLVQQQKEKAFSNTKAFLQECFNSPTFPQPVSEFMQLLASMKSDDQPNYKDFAKILTDGLNKLPHAPPEKLEFFVKRPMTMITSNWKLIVPKNVTANTEKSISESSCSEDSDGCEDADMPTSLTTKADAVPEKVTFFNVESPKQNGSSQFGSHVARADTNSSTKGHSAVKRCGSVTSTNRTQKRNGSVMQVTAKKREVAEISSGSKMKRDKSISPNSEVQRIIWEAASRKTCKRAVSSEIANSGSANGDAVICHRSSQSNSKKSIKRKSGVNGDAVPPKCLKRSPKFTHETNGQLNEAMNELDDSGVVVDNFNSQPSASSSFSHDRTINQSRVSFHSTPLHDAVKLKDFKEIKALLKKGAQIDARDADHNTPIHLAFLQKNIKILDILLAAMESSSSYKNVKNKLGLTTLHAACTRSNTTVIENLLKSRAALKDSVSEQSSMYKGFTAMHFAARYRSSEAMTILVSASSESDRQKKNGYGQTPLQMINQQLENLTFMSDLLTVDRDTNTHDNLSYFHVACAGNDPKLVEKFLKQGAPVNTPVDEDTKICCKYTPIHFAVERQNNDTVALLLDREVDLDKKNAEDMTPLHLALYTEDNGWREPLVDTLYIATTNKEDNPKDKNDLSYLHVACTRNDRDLVKRLLDKKKADVNSRVIYSDKKYYNYTPLHFATLYEHEEMVRLLIERGADLNASDGGHHGTPLHMAFDYGNKALIDMLLDNGADAKVVRSADKQTTLSCLVYGHIEIHDDEDGGRLLPYVERLIMEFGVDVNAKDHEGDTALHIACEKLSDCVPVIKLLLEFGADINVENLKGETPLMKTKKSHWQRDHMNHLVMLYHHVKKLEAFGFETNEKNKRWCQQLLAKRTVWKIEDLSDDRLKILEQKQLQEIKKMKNVVVVQDLSLHDLIMLEPNRYNEVSRLKFDTVEALANKFPIYGYLVRLKQRKCKMNARNPEAVEQMDQHENIDVVN